MTMAGLDERMGKVYGRKRAMQCERFGDETGECIATAKWIFVIKTVEVGL